MIYLFELINKKCQFVQDAAFIEESQHRTNERNGMEPA